MNIPKQGILAFINKTMHADADPLVVSRVFREKMSDTLCIKMNHSACDAGGLKEYVSILSDVYSRLCDDPGYSVRPNLCGRRDQSQVFEYIKDLENIEPKGGPRPTWTLPQKAGTSPLHFIRHITMQQFSAIKKYARDKKVTINDLLLTALYRALFDINNTEYEAPMTIQVSIDLSIARITKQKRYVIFREPCILAWKEYREKCLRKPSRGSPHL